MSSQCCRSATWLLATFLNLQCRGWNFCSLFVFLKSRVGGYNESCIVTLLQVKVLQLFIYLLEYYFCWFSDQNKLQLKWHPLTSHFKVVMLALLRQTVHVIPSSNRVKTYWNAFLKSWWTFSSNCQKKKKLTGRVFSPIPVITLLKHLNPASLNVN